MTQTRTPTVLVLGGTGSSGVYMIRALAKAGLTVRAGVRSASSDAIAKAAGAAECVMADLQDVAALQAAMAGVDTVQMTVPGPGTPGPAMADRTLHVPVDHLVANAIVAASNAGIGHFVLNTVLYPYSPAMPHHMEKARAEVLLRDSPLNWTVLQPATYAQNFLKRLVRAEDRLTFPVPYALTARLSPVDLADVAEVCAMVHAAPDHHRFATYELSGPEVLTQYAIADVLAEVVGEPVAATRISSAQAVPPGVAPDVANILRLMFEYYDRAGFAGNPFVLGTLLQRAPTTLGQMLQRERAALSIKE